MTNPHEKFDDLLDQWLDGELDQEQLAEWEALLAANPDLAEVARQEMGLVDALRTSARETKAPEDLAHQFLETLGAEEMEREGENRWAGMQRMGLLAAGILVFGSIYYFVGEPTLDDTTTREQLAAEMRVDTEVGTMDLALAPAEQPAAQPMTRDPERAEPPAADSPMMARAAAPPSPSTTDLENLRLRVTSPGNDLLLLTADSETARVVAAGEHAVLELPKERLYAVVRTSIPDELPTEPRALPLEELAGELAALRETRGEVDVDIVLEMANGSMLDDDAITGRVFEDAGLPGPPRRGDRQVTTWEFESIEDALLAVKLLQSDTATAADKAMKQLDLLPLGGMWLLLVHTEGTP
ncbi:MAG: hypothetical protein JJU11_02255 [Candidatus Sumerlaeia bacterium]|nr:hypothetical protein [Candidatus Sumerlaeia bacterium]